MKPIRLFDTKIAGLVATLPSWLEKPFKVVGLCASPLAWGFIIVLVAGIIRPDTVSPFIAAFICMPLATLIKFGFRRSRPPTIYAGTMRIKSYSFPSSHSYAAALSCTLLASLVSISFAPLFAVLAVVVGLSRIYLGAHYPSDVTAGLLFGLIIGMGVVAWF